MNDSLGHSNQTDTDQLSIGFDLDVDFDTAYKIFEDNFNNEEDDFNRANLKQQQIASINDSHTNSTLNKDNYPSLLEPQQTLLKTTKTPDPADHDNSIRLESNFTPILNPPIISVQTPIINTNHNNYVEPLGLTPRTLAFLNNEQNKPQRKYSHDNTSSYSGFSPDFYKRNQIFFPPGSFDNPSEFPSASNGKGATTATIPQQKTPDVTMHNFGLMLSPSNLNFNNNNNSNGLASYKMQVPTFKTENKTITPHLNIEHQKNQQNLHGNILSAKETDTIVNFLNQFERSQQKIQHDFLSNKILSEAPVIESQTKSDGAHVALDNINENIPSSKKRKLSYNELQEKVEKMEKKLSMHKNRHKISERKRRATINERFNELTDIIKYPRNHSEINNKARVTKYTLLDYAIEDISAVVENNKKLEQFIIQIQRQEEFQNWLTSTDDKQ